MQVMIEVRDRRRYQTEKLQMAFDPPPLIFVKSFCNFFDNYAEKDPFKGPKSII